MTGEVDEPSELSEVGGVWRHLLRVETSLSVFMIAGLDFCFVLYELVRLVSHGIVHRFSFIFLFACMPSATVKLNGAVGQRCGPCQAVCRFFDRTSSALLEHT